ncbi:MAG TPA: choice-of-anchor D domain-containing protein [Myxococcales bacterium]|jgi:hypothetical protein
MRGWIGAAVALATLAGCDCGGGKTNTTAGKLVVEERQLDFGEVCRKPSAAGVTVSSATQIVHLSNEGTALAYVNKFAIDPAEPQFTFDKAQVPETLEAGETVEIALHFTPTATGNQTASLLVEGETAEQGGKVTLLGAGNAKPADPVFTMSCKGGLFGPDADGCAPASGVTPYVFFAETPVGATGEMTIKISNGGCPEMQVKNIAAVNVSDASLGTFVLANPKQTALTIPGGGSATIKVQFLPLSGSMPADGYLLGSLAFDTDDPANGKVALQLKGIGIVPLLEVSPYECRFESLGLPCDGHFTLKNNSSADLTVNAVSVEKASPMFQISQAPAANSTLAAGATTAVKVDYAPAMAKGEDKLVVDWSGGKVTVRLTGGSPPMAALEPSSTLEFDDENRFKAVTLQNLATWNRQLPLTITSLELSADSTAFDLPTSPPDPVACPPAPAANTKVAAGESIKACVHFNGAAGSAQYLGQLHVKTDDPAHADMELSLVAYMTCSRPPVGMITAPVAGSTCPCTEDQVCIGTVCHQSSMTIVNLGEFAVELSGEGSYDLTKDATTSACTVEDKSAVKFWDWSVVQSPEGATAAVNPGGKQTSPKTTLTFDTQGWYQVQLVVTDGDLMEGAPVSFNVYVNL